MSGLASLPKRVDVAIVGGGPGGLSMAKAISRARPGTTIRVLESASCYVPQGAGVTVDINGWRALNAIDPTLHDRLRPRGFLFQGGAFRDKVGNEVPSPFAGKSTVDHEGNLAKHGTTLVTFPWHEVRAGLHDSLEPGTVTFGAVVVSSSVGNLADGQPSTLIIAPSASSGCGGLDAQSCEQQQQQQHEMEAGLVIAADGYFSSVRRQAFGSNDLQDVGKVIWRALLTFDGEEAVPEVLQGLKFGWSISWMDNTPEGLPLRNAMVYPVTPTSFVWTAIAPTSDLRDAGVSAMHSGGRRGEQAKEHVLAMLRGWDPAFVQLVDMSHPSTVTEHGYYTHDVSALAQGCWVRGNVVVTGDAAHSGPPDGQGMNLAFEDAAVMGAMLQRHGLTARALEEWEAARIPRVQAIFGEKTYVKPKRDQAVWSSSFEPLGVPNTAVA